MSDIGHNSGNVAGQELLQFIERIERLLAEKQAIQGDITDVYGEAKGRGFDTRTIKAVIAKRKKDTNQRMEEETLLAVYLKAIGMDFDEDGI